MSPPPPPPPRSEADDDALVAAAKGGDRAALEQLLRRHHDRVATLCRQLCRSPSDAEDATQEALIAIVRGLDRFDGRSRFSTWLYRVTTNACLDELRRRKRRPEPTDPERIPEPVSDDDPASAAVGSNERRDLAAALDSLPEEFRAPLVLRDVADLDYAAIGEILDLPPGTVRSRIARARARLAAAVPHLSPEGRSGPAGGNQDPSLDVGTSP